MSTDNLTSGTSAPEHKFKTPFAKIVVNGTVEKPYYTILWWGGAKQTMIEGYGSYNLSTVYRWLTDEFEVDLKGYRNLEIVTRGHWKVVFENSQAAVYECSRCGHLEFGISDHCVCGAKMIGVIRVDQ